MQNFLNNHNIMTEMIENYYQVNEFWKIFKAKASTYSRIKQTQQQNQKQTLRKSKYPTLQTLRMKAFPIKHTTKEKVRNFMYPSLQIFHNRISFNKITKSLTTNCGMTNKIANKQKLFFESKVNPWIKQKLTAKNDKFQAP